MKYLTILALLAASAAYGKEPPQSFFKYGVGIANSATESRAEVKILTIGRTMPLGSLLAHQWEVGGWVDNSSDQTRKGSGFGSYAFGVNVNAGYLYAQSLWGVCAITTRDSYLGGNLQFNQDLSVGLRDSRGVMVGANYKHISSAGIFMPNQGRDFLLIRLAIPW